MNDPSEFEVKSESRKHITKFLDILKNDCSPMIEMDYITCERNFLNLLKGLTSSYFEEDIYWRDNKHFVHKATFFCALWAVFSTINREDQVKVDTIIRKHGTDVPVYGTVFDYYIDHETLAWEHWNKNVTEWNYNPKEPHSSFFIQTTEFIKFEFILNLLIHQGTHVLLLGPKGCG